MRVETDTRVTGNWSCSSRQSNDGENILQANIFRKSHWSALLFCLSIVIYHRCFQALWDIRRAKNAVLSNIKEIRYLKFLEKNAIFSQGSWLHPEIFCRTCTDLSLLISWSGPADTRVQAQQLTAVWSGPEWSWIASWSYSWGMCSLDPCKLEVIENFLKQQLQTTVPVLYLRISIYCS